MNDTDRLEQMQATLDEILKRLEAAGFALWSLEDVARAIGVSTMTVRRLMESNPDTFPAPVVIGTHASNGRPMKRYDPTEIRRWVATQRGDESEESL